MASISSRLKTWAALGILTGAWLMVLLQAIWVYPDRPWPPAAPKSESRSGPELTPIDAAALRARAWGQIAGRLDAADRASLAEIGRSLAQIDAFFASRRGGARPFAAAVLSLGGKWRFIKSHLPFADEQCHARFLQEQLAEHLLRPEELPKLLEGCVAGYLIRVRAMENQLLVQIRADLSESDLRAYDVIPALQSTQQFASQFQQLQGELTLMVGRDLNLTLSKEVAVLVGGEVAAQVALRVGLAVAERFGVSAGILGAGAASGWATFGLGLVVAIGLDFTVDGLLHLAGHDPEGQVAAKVEETLWRLQRLIVAGDPEAVLSYQKLRNMEAAHASGQVRLAAREAADAIERSGNLGLRHELQRLHELRARVRRAALEQLILQGLAREARTP
jgi:hypothetical protein